MNKAILFLCLIALAFPSLGKAKDRFDVTNKPEGAITQWQANDGVVSVKYAGVDQDGHKFLFTRDASKGQPLSLTSWSIRNGDTVKAIIDGVTFTYAPHDCSLTLGRCTYRETNSKLGYRDMIWNAKIIDGFWHYTRHIGKISSKTLMERGVFTLDDAGYVIDRDYETHQDGKQIRKGWLRRMR